MFLCLRGYLKNPLFAKQHICLCKNYSHNNAPTFGCIITITTHTQVRTQVPKNITRHLFVIPALSIKWRCSLDVCPIFVHLFLTGLTHKSVKVWAQQVCSSSVSLSLSQNMYSLSCQFVITPGFDRKNDALTT